MARTPHEDVANLFWFILDRMITKGEFVFGDQKIGWFWVGIGFGLGGLDLYIERDKHADHFGSHTILAFFE